MIQPMTHDPDQTDPRPEILHVRSPQSMAPDGVTLRWHKRSTVDSAAVTNNAQPGLGQDVVTDRSRDLSACQCPFRTGPSRRRR
jgi:hypothetical protein